MLREQVMQGELDDPALNPYASPSQYGPTRVDSPEHRELALETAQQGIVMLSNRDKLLPLPGNSGAGAAAKTFAFVGPHANTSLGLLGNYFGGNSVVFQNTPLLAARRLGIDVSYEPGYAVRLAVDTIAPARTA